MSEPKTPNLGLNKIDRSSPSTTYFDLDKYLDQNWEKIDDFSEQMEEKTGETATQVSGIQERLDTEKRRSVTLEPGLQVVNAERASAFKLEGLKGRTLVNLLGRDGGCEAVSDWFTTTGVAAALDSSDKAQGTNSIKITTKTGNTDGSLYYLLGTILSNSKNYLAIADLKKGTSTSVSLSLWNGTVNVSGTVVTASKFTPSVLLIPAPAVGAATNNLQISVGGTEAGQYSHVDSVRLYEITAAELTSLSSMTAEQVAAKYPYVDSVQPVRNPYAIRYGENLLPPFYEWEAGIAAGDNMSIDNPHKVTINATTVGGSFIRYYVPVLPSQQYTLSVTAQGANARPYIYLCRKDRTRIDSVKNPFGTITPSQETVYLEVVLNTLDSNNIVATGTAVFTEASMTIGSAVQPFKPREDAMLAFQTDLYADPLTGANADEVFEKDGQYFKLAKWKKITELSSLSGWIPLANGTGWKSVTASGANLPPALILGPVGVTYGTKFDGKVLRQYASPETADMIWIASDNSVRVAISSADSGWGDAYTPTAEEIKAYFIGWTMFNGAAGTGVGNSPDVPSNNVYNGTGTKWWARRSDGVARTWADATNALPTTQAQNWTPYQLVYQLATANVEPVASEGQLTFIEGDNQIEVGTGIVLREYAPITKNPPVAAAMNDASYPSRYKVKKFIRAYKNGKYDPAWYASTLNSYGLEKARINWADFDETAAYRVTYLMMDTSPTTSFVGSIAENEKSLITDLVQDVQQATARLSVVELKKAEKDAPAWITPTLLNGWVDYDTVRRPVGYYKDSEGWVHVQGFIKGGATAFGTVIFNFPEGYKPDKPIEVNATSADPTTSYASTLYVGTNSLQCDLGVKNSFLILDFKYRAK
ncbi:hypothetical protein JNUCC31_21645 [Paenibacillus sp. JNUCC31]|uniref:hypothetical protein n=1 Tax=Paenibacillus sp. JNUCC-31 TaxID=2777983 RepID=UPI00177CAAEE|nr:hypothetical protein [Paenibacillus sp. JNUCC-31]QOS77380.1 hypothetical protein JNUCC31_21645 [Paenibacillus sp. JNUCC-31]